MRDSIITITIGAVGVGKTYSRCANFLATEFIPNHHGVHYSNFPINKEVLVDWCHKKYKIDNDVLNSRIQIIPSDVVQGWMDGEMTFSDYFDDKDLQDAHIAIDEAHNFFPFANRDNLRVKQCVQFLGEIRHRGCTIELLTQNVGNLPVAIREKATKTIEIVSCESDYDIYFKIQNYYWYELRAAWLKEYCPKLCEITSSQNSSGEVVKRFYYRNKYFYKFYDSYSKPFAGGVKGTAPKHEFQKRSFLGLHWWFFTHNLYELFSRLFIVLSVVWLSSGGMSFIFNWIIDDFNIMACVGTPTAQVEKVKPATDTKAVTEVVLTPEQIALSCKDAEIEQLKTVIQQCDKLVDHLKNELSYNSSIVMLTPGKVILSNGYVYNIGDTIDYGIYKTKRIVQIKMDRREVVFSDTSVARVGLYHFEQDSE